MTRKEQIQEAAKEYDLWKAGQQLFIVGAQWADKHPRKGLVDIDDVCRYIENCTWPIESVKDKFIFSDELRKAMEE
jgi:hypothetical protein